MAWQTPKTNWQAADVVQPADFNRVEGNIQAVEQGDRTIDPTQTPTGVVGTLRQLLDWLSNRIKAIMGTTNWYDAPPTTLTAAKGHMDAASPHSGHATTGALSSHTGETSAHSATSAATASRIMMRDAYGRAKVAAPSASDDVARKDTVDVVQSNLDAHKADVATEEGRHGLRIFDNDFQARIDDEWITIVSKAIFDDETGSPGNKKLIAGTMQAGFFGEVSASELIAGDALATQCGISQGTGQNSTAGWLKFAWQNKILFVAKKPIRNSISWDAINTAKCVYGGSGDKTIVVDGLTYKVRLLKGANKDPAGAYNGAICHGSEWNRLMLPIHQEAINKNWAYPDNVESDIPVWAHSLGTGTQSRYTDEDLLTKSDYGSGSYSWCQEVAESSANQVYRGNNGVSNSSSSTSSNTISYYGWRPCLEVSV